MAQRHEDRSNSLSVIVRVTGALNLWGGQPKPPENFSQQIENPMINLYEKTEKVTLVNPFRPPHKNFSYAALFSHTMTFKVICYIHQGYLATSMKYLGFEEN